MSNSGYTNLDFRIAELTDVDAINALVNSAYRGEFSKKGWTTEAELLDGQRIDINILSEIISSKDNLILLCLQNNELIGTVMLHRKSECAYLGMLTVRSDLQALGIGKKILNAAENFILTEWNLTRVEMTVIQQRVELIDWYKRRGYIPTGETRPFPYNDQRFGKPKVQDLGFIVLEKTINGLDLHPKPRFRL